MSIQAPTNCECAGFNPSCYGLLTGTTTGGLNPNDYLLFPVGQGVETLPALIDLGDMTVSNNINLTGIEGVNYIQFPDDTEQFTAFTGAGTLQQIIPFTPYSLPSGGVSNAFNEAIILSYYLSTIKTYNVLAFSGGGQSNIFYETGNPSNGQPFSVTVPGTSASGSGLSMKKIPVVTGQAGNLTYALQTVFQPSLANPNYSPTASNAWSGTFVMNISGNSFQISIKTTASGNATNIAIGTSFVVPNAPFGCPSSFIIVSILTPNSQYGISIGCASNNPTYYVSQDVTGYSQPAGSLKCKGTISITGNQMTLTPTTGTLNTGQSFWGWIPQSNIIVFVKATPYSQTTFVYTVVGLTNSLPISTQTAYFYLAFNGVDTYVSTWQGASWQRNAIIRGATSVFPASTVTSGSGGSITIQQSVGTVQQYLSTIGTAGFAQSTQSYPTGLVTFTNTVVGNSYAQSNSVVEIQNCANCGSAQFTPTPYATQSVADAGLGGVELRTYS
jgi:hypothetical protein